jgi:hypothetical protein
MARYVETARWEGMGKLVGFRDYGAVRIGAEGERLGLSEEERWMLEGQPKNRLTGAPPVPPALIAILLLLAVVLAVIFIIAAQVVQTP